MCYSVDYIYQLLLYKTLSVAMIAMQANPDSAMTIQR